MSRSNGEREKLPLLSKRGCRGGSWISAVLALPAGVFARHARVVRDFKYCFSSIAFDR
jgi:hypothetical protein